MKICHCNRDITYIQIKVDSTTYKFSLPTPTYKQDYVTVLDSVIRTNISYYIAVFEHAFKIFKTILFDF